MNEDHYILEQIDLYLDGKLKGKALEDFEALLQTDSNLQQELELERTLRNSVEIYGDTLLKEELAQEFQLAKKNHKLKRWVSYSVLALGVATVGYFALSSEEEKAKKTTISEVIQDTTSEQEEIETIEENISDSVVKEKVKTEHPTTLKGTTTEPEVLIQNSEKETPVPVKDSIVSTSEVKKEIPVLTDSVKVEYKVQAPRTPIDPCTETTIIAKAITEATCENAYEGSIKIQNVQGGKAPYLYSIDKTNWQNANLFLNLSQGSYTVYVKDANNCLSEISKTAYVEEKNCYQPAKGFNPNYETWEYKIDVIKPVKITLRGKDGKVVLQKETDANFVWDGTDLFGKRVPSGLYIYTIEGETVEQGSVTVIY